MKALASRGLPPRGDRTYFSSGRAAFAFLIGEVIRPRRVLLPTLTCWSLVSTVQRRFPMIELGFYPVGPDLRCEYPKNLGSRDVIVVIHYFGHSSDQPLPSGGTVVEDFSHAVLSRFARRGQFAFGSLRKLIQIADGGFVDGFFNPIYEPSRKLDTWLRYEATDWRDLREAENMLDREWSISDMSSQSLSHFLSIDETEVRSRRAANERHLFENLRAGRPLLEFFPGECPLVHHRIFSSHEERDALRRHLAADRIYTSIHWPVHGLVAGGECDSSGATLISDQSLAFPVGDDLGVSDMTRICESVQRWSRAGA